jgi:hypothetical protein
VLPLLLLLLLQYPYYRKSDFDPLSLMTEDLVREAVRNVTIALELLAQYNQTLRITEANSISRKCLELLYLEHFY